MSEWRKMDDYPIKDYRDETGKWHPGPDGPVVDLKMPQGRIVRGAQWRGEKNVQGGTSYAFWAPKDMTGIGHYDPIGWRPSKTGA